MILYERKTRGKNDILFLHLFRLCLLREIMKSYWRLKALQTEKQ